MKEYLENNFKKSFVDGVELLIELENNGFKAYFVGGCVRDFLLGKNFSDIDITTSATPDEVKQIFTSTIDTGIKHGTVTVKYKNNFYEVTTFRSEGKYTDYRRPEKVYYEKSLDKDLERRDFTINAMALDKNGNILDFHDGLTDLNSKVIRTVNNANERFQEDALRMLRAFRFSSQLEFNIYEDTLKAVENNAELIKYVSIERVVTEFRKLFLGKNNIHSFSLLKDSGLNKYIPFFEYIRNYEDVSKLNFAQALFILSELNNIQTTEINKLKISNKELKSIKNYKLIKEQFESNINLKLILYKYNREDVHFVNDIYGYYSATELENIILPISNRDDINIKTTELINLFPYKKQGIWIKELLEEIEKNIILENIKNNKQDIIDFVKVR